MVKYLTAITYLLLQVQNADDNVYTENVEPTLTFILQESGIIVLNNEQGFSAQNIRALCDVGSSTKKGHSGYIGKKGIGFKSVFRVPQLIPFLYFTLYLILIGQKEKKEKNSYFLIFPVNLMSYVTLFAYLE